MLCSFLQPLNKVPEQIWENFIFSLEARKNPTQCHRTDLGSCSLPCYNPKTVAPNIPEQTNLGSLVEPSFLLSKFPTKDWPKTKGVPLSEPFCCAT